MKYKRHVAPNKEKIPGVKNAYALKGNVHKNAIIMNSFRSVNAANIAKQAGRQNTVKGI